jgi:hypothetical protein
MPVAYNIAWEAPCDLGCVILEEILLSLGSASLARLEEVEERPRLQIVRYSSKPLLKTYIYLEAVLEVREALAPALKCGSIFAVVRCPEFVFN